jgi:hypothetical protein
VLGEGHLVLGDDLSVKPESSLLRASSRKPDYRVSTLVQVSKDALGLLEEARHRMLDPWGVSPPRVHRLVAQATGQDDLGSLAPSIGHHAIEGLWWVEGLLYVELLRVHAPT